MTATLPWPLLAKGWINYLSLLYFLSRFISVCQMSNACSLVIFIHSVVLAYILFKKTVLFCFFHKKINNYSRWNTCTIAHKHKHSHFRPKATGLHYLSGSLGRKKNNNLLTRTTPSICASEYVATYSLVSAGLLLSPECLHHASSWPLSVSLCSLWRISGVGVTLRSNGLSLTTWGAAGEEVSGHLSLPLHLDDTSTFQLVSIVGQHVVQVCSHLRDDTDIWHSGY